jgi:acetyl esterase/lipase
MLRLSGRLGIALALWVALAGCLTTSVAWAEDPPVVPKVETITYVQRGDVPIQLNLQRPTTGEGPFPAIVFIHGGGWAGGSRLGYLGQINEATKRGYVALTISYRLTQPDPKTKVARHPFPTQIHDCKAAIRWLKQHAQEYNVDPNRIGVTGGSAGGHLSLLIGLTDDKAGLEGDGGDPNISTRVQAVVNVFGPTDMVACCKTSPGAKPIIESFLGGTADEVPEAYKVSSPVTYVSADDPPVLTLHGDKDTLVPPEQAKILDEKLKAAGGQHTLRIIEGAGHGFGGPAAELANKATWDFFAEHLKPGK